jgi:hypothetical protein
VTAYDAIVVVLGSLLSPSLSGLICMTSLRMCATVLQVYFGGADTVVGTAVVQVKHSN